MTLYPNPVHDQVTLNTHTSAKGDVKVIDGLGRVHLQAAIEPQVPQISLDVSGLESGVYALVFQNVDTHQIQSTSFVKQ